MINNATNALRSASMNDRTRTNRIIILIVKLVIAFSLTKIPAKYTIKIAYNANSFPKFTAPCKALP